MKKLIKTIFIILVLGIVFFPLTVTAEDYPSRPITLTVAYAPGGSSDLYARAIAQFATKYLTQPIVVVNKPGASGMIALQSLASSKPNGYTFHFGRAGEMSVAPNIEKMPFTMEKDFIPVAQILVERIIFSVNAKMPWKTIEEFVEAARKEPGTIKFACSSATSLVRLAMEKFCHEAGIKLTAVPFKGGAPAVLAVVGGHVPVLTCAHIEIIQHVEQGALKVLLAAGEPRISVYPDVPTAKEKGFDVNLYAYGTFFAPNGTPPGIIQKFEGFMKKISLDEEFISSMKKMGTEVKFRPGSDFAKFWSEDLKAMRDIVEKVGLDKKP